MGFKPLILKSRFISTVIGSLAIYFSIAFAVPISNFSVYITSHIHMKQDFVTMHYGMFINLIFSFAMTFSSPLGGVLENYIGFLKTTYLGLIILLGGAIGFIFQQNIWLCYGLSLIVGIGVGISISLLSKNLVFYHPDKKGIIGGLCGIWSALISAIFTYFGEKTINNEGYTLIDNEQYYPDYIAERTYIYFILGAISIPIGLIISIFFIHVFKPEYSEKENNNENTDENNNKEENEEKNEDIEENNSSKNISEKEKSTNESLKELKKESSKNNVKQAFKSFRFWRLGFISLFLNFSITFITYTGRTFGALIGINGTALQLMAIFMALSYIIAGPILGVLVDKKGALNILRAVSIICIVPGILLTFFMENTLIFLISFFVEVIGVSGIIICFGPLIMEIYGIQESVILGGIISAFSKISEIATTVSAFMVSLFYKEVEELKIPYRILYIISSICCVISIILLFFESNEKINYSYEIPMKDEDPSINQD